jgi:cytidylate kinase
VFRIVTVSREYGSGAGRFARLLGESLGWPVFDRVIGEQAAARLGVDASDVSPAEEREDSLLERLERAFSLGPPEMIGHSPAESWTEQVFRAERDEIRKIAESPPAVVVGRGSQCLLKGRADTLHVRLHAPEADRIARVAQRSQWPRERAAAMVRRVDAARRRFLATQFECSDDQQTLYGVSFNTAVVPIETATAMVSMLVNS